MKAPQQVLIASGLALIAFTMGFGVWYAIFDEHQTLDAIGASLAGAFVHAAGGDMAAAVVSLENYAALDREYRYEVHAHGHWGMLAIILIIMGLVFQRLGLSPPRGLLLAWVLAGSAALFPLGVLLQIGPLLGAGKVLAVAGSAGMIAGMLVFAYCLWRRPQG